MDSAYLAARYGRRDELRTYAALLMVAGIHCSSSWLNETSALTVRMRDVKEDELREIALTDIKDIELADALVFFAEDQEKQPPRGGRHVEFGYALARGKEIHVIGARENIFHHLPHVTIHASFDEFLKAVDTRGLLLSSSER